MKYIIVIMITFFSYSMAIVNGSKHDLTYLLDDLSEDDGRICAFCHTPNGSSTHFSGNALWDPSLVFNDTVYNVYNETQEGDSNPSKACLSCHDGVSAVNATIKHEVTNELMNENFMMSSHPISKDYNEEKASLYSKGSSFGAEASNYQTDWDTPDGSQNIESVLRNGKIECVSCHNPHLGENKTFLRVKSNQGSALCLGCHNK